ncbi:MAG: SEL1-like repeat protein [Bacteroidaceae bacterium]|nr:SEL1-like repeat protein [Bacteroidaceae bacterium]
MSAEDNFFELSSLRPVLDESGNPIMSSGNFAVVFKMQDGKTGKFHAVKCFLKEQEGRSEAYKQIADELEFVSSNFLTPIKYYERELFVDSANTDEEEFPVLLMDWVEGVTLDKFIREHLDDTYELEMLAYKFSRLAMWLLPQPFAHGDLKPDNILVREDGTLALVDYDGMFVPAMRGQKARELGSPDFRHPSRTEDDFDEHIDDLPVISILLSLKAIAVNPHLLEEYGAADRLLFSEKDYLNICECEVWNKLSVIKKNDIQKLIECLFIILDKKIIASDLYLMLCIYLFNNNNDKVIVIDTFFQKELLARRSIVPLVSETIFSLFEIMANQGNSVAQNRLGVFYDKGIWVKQDQKQAIEWFRMSAERGNALAQNNLGACYAEGDGVNQNWVEAVKWFIKSAEQGDSMAQLNLGFCFEKGYSVNQDHEEAVKWYRKSAEQGNFIAQFNLGNHYKNGRGINQSYEEAAKWYKESAVHGYNKAQYNLGLLFELGYGLNQDNEEAIKWYKKSADQGYFKAQFALGLCYARGKGISQDYSEAVKWYQKSAKQGFSNAQNNLGLCYAEGNGVCQDYVEAVKWYRNSAEQGNDIAQNNLGNCYAEGNGVGQDYKEAAYWYKKSAEQGNPNAQSHIGGCFLEGLGVSKDYQQAYKWFFKSANQNNMEGQFNLGRCYYYGWGVKVNYKTAVRWLKKSVNKGNEKAKRLLGECYRFGRGIEKEKDDTRYKKITWLDENNVKYSKYWYRLLECPKMMDSYAVLEGTKEISKYAFSDCKYLRKIIIPYGVETIEDFAFNGCSSLMQIQLPESVEYIGKGAFCGCTLLLKIVIPNTKVRLNMDCFDGCFCDIEYGDKIYKIRGNCIYSNDLAEIVRCSSNVKDFVIPNFVVAIRKHAFENLNALRKIIIPDSVKTIDRESFARCSSLKSIRLLSSCTDINIAFDRSVNGSDLNNTILNRIVIPKGSRAHYESILSDYNKSILIEQ